MAGKGVKLETAYIELEIDGSGVEKGVQDSLDRAGTHAKDAGRKMGKGISEGLKESAKDIGGSIKDSLEKAGTNARAAGKKMGKDISEGVREGTKDIGGHIRDSLDKSDSGAAEAGRKTGKRISDGLRESLKGIGSEIGGTLRDELGKAGIEGTISGAASGAHALSDALKGLGQNDAAGTLDTLANKFDQIQSTTSSLKGNIEGTTNGFLTLTNNSGRIAGGLSAIAGAAGPLAATFATLAEINPVAINALSSIADQLQGKKPFNLKDWANGLIPGTTYLDQPIRDIFGPSPLSPGKAPSTASNNFTPGDFLPSGAGGNFYKDWYGAAGTDGGAGVTMPDSLGGLLGVAAPSGRRGGTGPGGGAAIVPAGVYNGPNDSGGFPQWVNDIGGKYSIKPSTYGGHQTSNRAEAGFAPNPQNFNRGIDWNGSTEDLQRFADFALQHPELFEQVIWNNPKTGQKVGIAGGRIVGDSYYANDYGGHTDHVHTRFSQGFQFAQLPSYDTGGPVPEDMAAYLHGGEHVLNPEQVKALGGPDGVQALVNAADNPPDQGPGLNRTEGFMPAAAAGNAGGVAGTSSLAGLLNLGNQAVAGLIDTGASAAETALSAAATAGSFGAGGQAAGALGGIGIQLGATEAKRAASFGFQALSILGDAAVEQLFPFGAPRWIGYDYTSFLPDLNISQIGTTTAEKAVQQSMGQQGDGGDGLKTIDQTPGGPVNPMTLPGAQPPGAPVPAYGPTPGAPPPGGPAPQTGPGGGGPGTPPTAGLPPQLQLPTNVLPPNVSGRQQFYLLTPTSLGGLLGVYDEGGVWPSGTLGINTSGRPELVLSGQHLDQLTAKKPAPRSGGDTYNIYGDNPDEIARKIDSKKRLAMMRYGGRF